MGSIKNISISEVSLLQVKDLQAILNISRSMAYHLIKTRKIPAIRINSAVRVHPADLTKYINNCRND